MTKKLTETQKFNRKMQRALATISAYGCSKTDCGDCTFYSVSDDTLEYRLRKYGYMCGRSILRNTIQDVTRSTHD